MDETTGNTTSVSPGAFNLRSGVGDIEPEGDSLVFHAEQGNIIIKADAGDITLIGDSINLHAVGAEGKGHVTITAARVTVDAKKVLVNAKSMFKIASPGTGEIIANSVLKMYGSLIKGVTDGCSLKDGKYGDLGYPKNKYTSIGVIGHVFYVDDAAIGGQLRVGQGICPSIGEGIAKINGSMHVLRVQQYLGPHEFSCRIFHSYDWGTYK